jgi:hypothetical protein
MLRNSAACGVDLPGPSTRRADHTKSYSRTGSRGGRRTRGAARALRATQIEGATTFRSSLVEKATRPASRWARDDQLSDTHRHCRSQAGPVRERRRSSTMSSHPYRARRQFYPGQWVLFDCLLRLVQARVAAVSSTCGPRTGPASESVADDTVPTAACTYPSKRGSLPGYRDCPSCHPVSRSGAVPGKSLLSAGSCCSSCGGS